MTWFECTGANLKEPWYLKEHAIRAVEDIVPKINSLDLDSTEDNIIMTAALYPC